MAGLRIPDDLAATIRGLHPDLKKKVRAALAAIAADPSAGKALKADLVGLRSYQIGRFRIVFRWAGEGLEVVAVGPRRVIYEETWRRVQKGLRVRGCSLPGNGLTEPGSTDGRSRGSRSPDEIRRSRTDPSVFLFYRLERERRWVCAVSRRLDGEGFLITAYPTDAVKEGDPVWPR